MRRTLIALSISPILLVAPFTFAWTGPTAAAPGGNVSAPLNVGSTDQIKSANLGVNGLAVFGNSLLQAGSYLNWGATAGTGGYGIRDNAGTLEFKNSGGSWASLQSTVSTLVGGGGSWAVSGNDIHNSNTGNVGIGAAAPSDKLTIYNGNVSAGNITLGNLFASTYNSLYLNGQTGQTNYNVLSSAADQNLYLNRPTGKGMYFREANNDEMTIAPGGNVGIGVSPSYRLQVNGAAGSWTEVLNWPPGSVNAYGILVGTGAGKYSQFQNAEGYYTMLANSSWGVYTNGNIYASGYFQGYNSFGGIYDTIWDTGACNGANPFTGGCSCPGFAPNVSMFGIGYHGSGYEYMYQCY